MKKLLLVCIAILAAASGGFAADPAGTAVLRSITGAAGKMSYYIEITTAENIDATVLDSLKCPDSDGNPCDLQEIRKIGGLFKDDVYVSPLPRPGGIPFNLPIAFNDCLAGEKNSCEARNKFRIYLPDDPSLVTELGKYAVVFYNFPLKAAEPDKEPPVPEEKALPWRSGIVLGATRIVDAANSSCGGRDRIGFFFRAENLRNTRRDLFRWFDTDLRRTPGALRLKTNEITSKTIVPNPVKSVITVTFGAPGDDDSLSVCLEMTADLPRSSFNALIEYDPASGAPPPPYEVIEPTRVDKVTPLAVPAGGSAAEDTKDVEKRALNDKLDFVFTFDSHRVTKTENNVSRVERDTLGIFDLRLVPFKHTFFKPVAGTKNEIHYLDVKPFFIDAKVSTGKIEKNTASLNRINLGTDIEYRYFQRFKKHPTYYQFNFRGINASDRDFKLVEGKFNFEFRPVIKIFNKQLADNGKSFKDPLPPNEEFRSIPGKWGFLLVPTFGFEFGKTYRNHNPAPGFDEKPKIFRGIFGFSLVVNPLDWITFTLDDKFYSRSSWEKGDRGINYLKTTLDFSLGKKFNVPQSVVFSYENGKQPPFTDEVVNTFKIGYRIQMNNLRFFQ
jgi:hypothetical protein